MLEGVTGRTEGKQKLANPGTGIAMVAREEGGRMKGEEEKDSHSSELRRRRVLTRRKDEKDRRDEHEDETEYITNRSPDRSKREFTQWET